MAECNNLMSWAFKAFFTCNIPKPDEVVKGKNKLNVQLPHSRHNWAALGSLVNFSCSSYPDNCRIDSCSRNRSSCGPPYYTSCMRRRQSHH